MNSFSPICLLLCISTLTLAFFPRTNAQSPSEDDVPPSIVVQPEPVNIDTRKVLLLRCEASGTPEPTYKWEKNGTFFDVDQEVHAQLEGGNLRIYPVTKADNGIYQCFANNHLGTAMSQKILAAVAFMDQFKSTASETVTKRVGESLKMNCGGSGGLPASHPAAYVYWTDDSEKPTPITYNARINQDLNGNLVFSNVQPSDEKGYYCLAMNNAVGSSQRSPLISLNIDTDLPPAPNKAAVLATKPAASEIAVRSQEFKMKCIAYGNPTPDITWTRGDEQLQSEGRVIIEEFGQELVISNVDSSDSGTYTCTARNSEGEDSFSTVVSVESAPYFPNPPSDETKGPGESVEIVCLAQGVPTPNTVWLVNGQPYDEYAANVDPVTNTDSRWTVISGVDKRATISITNLQTTDSNVFQCIATNKYREELTSVVLNVVSIPARIPNFTPVTRRLSVLQDGSAEFICHVEGRPTPTITWTFKGMVLTDGGKYNIDDVEGRLVINDAMEVDEGVYECTAENTIDAQVHSETDDATLTVLGQTTIDVPPFDLTIKEGAVATFQCEMSYDQELDRPTVIWMKGDQELEADPDDNSLRIEDAMISDSGTYTCVVKTTVDQNAGTVQEVNASAELIVKGRPEPPQDLELRIKESEFAVDIFWQPGNDNNAPIQYYMIQYDTKWSDMRWQSQANETVNEQVNPPYRKVLHLQPFVDYRFRIIAVNEIGQSEPSNEIAPAGDPQPAAPSKNPTGVTGGGTNPQSMVIRWQAIHPFYYGGDDFRYVVAFKPRGSNEPSTTADVYPDNTDDNPTGVIQNYIVDARKPYEEFEFSVQSVNSVGEAPEPITYYGFSGEAAPSAAPSGVQVVAISAQEVNITWDPVSQEDANGQLGGYNVYYNARTASGQSKQMCPQSPCMLRDLQAATTYEITVKAFTGAGEGPASDMVTVVTDSAPPGPVYKLTVDPFSYRLVLNWQEPILTNGGLEGYKVKIQKVSESSETLDEEETFEFMPEDELTLKYKTDPETRYRVEVRAYNEMGEGEISLKEPTTSQEGRPSKPPAPEIDGIGTDHANFTWDITNLNPTVSLVEIQYKLKDDQEFQTSEQFDVLDEDLIMVSGLESSTTYTARLRVTNDAGSTVSPTTEFKTTGTGALADDGFVLGTWMIILICIIILLILILLIICIIKSQKGGKYNVSDKEKQLNKDIESTPLKDDGGFDEYKPPTGADGEPLRGSQGSLDDSEHGSSETDSLKEYADGETGKFDEEGSFIGQYGDNKKQRQPDDEQGGAAYSTFV
ncbi:neuronal cell adhesion molecule-like isoform X3 [Lytechinus variegatus]|uniref:neuronal cell adhesion molecule-like isoform X3 n=1 Tax=Lytechinus variegatus TaxID=7654 RepID=UPI001BB1E613|nr:neuronal cell adhesion molecule-like isoform X3 [Lytechinus variegatus]